MNIIIIGLGSMGRRRIRLLFQMGCDYRNCGVDSKTERRENAAREFSIDTFGDLTEALNIFNPQCAIISTSPLSHADIIEECLKHGCHVFTELNLVADKYESNMELARKRGRVLFLSSTFLYREEIRYIENRINQELSRVNYIYHVGQYLPDWHPWESIEDYFVGDKKTNGCRELMAIEFPWIIKTFGEIESYEFLSDKNSGLPISYRDNYLMLLKHSNGNKGVFGVDVISRKAVRNLEIYGEDVYISWDGTPYGLMDYDFDKKTDKTVRLYDSVDKQDEYASFVIENAYMNELKTFFNMINEKGSPEYTFEDDLKVLELIDRIETGKSI